MTLKEFLDKIPRGKLLLIDGGRYYEAEETLRAFVRLVRERAKFQYERSHPIKNMDFCTGTAFNEIASELGIEESKP